MGQLFYTILIAKDYMHTFMDRPSRMSLSWKERNTIIVLQICNILMRVPKHAAGLLLIWGATETICMHIYGHLSRVNVRCLVYMYGTWDMVHSLACSCNCSYNTKSRRRHIGINNTILTLLKYMGNSELKFM